MKCLLKYKCIIPVLLCLYSTFLSVNAASSIIPIEGIDDLGRYYDRVSFIVPTEAGYNYNCVINGKAVLCGQWVEINLPDYYELHVQRVNLHTSQSEYRIVRFVVQSTERGNTEFGLPPWTPYPSIPSSSAEFNGIQLECVAPSKFPAGIKIPLIGYLVNETEAATRLNGNVRIDWLGLPTIFVMRRGYGFTFLPPASQADTNTATLSLHHLSISQPIVVETNVSWIPVGGMLDKMTDWPENSHVRITSDLHIATSARLRIGASSLIQLSPGINIHVHGALHVEGDRRNPVVFMPVNDEQPWGGILTTNSSASVYMTGTILTGSGGNKNFFLNQIGHYHRKEQPLFLAHNGARVSLTNCFIIDNAGQFGNGYNSYLTLDHCLVQRCITGGEYFGGAVEIYNSALMEFPFDTEYFADQDEDGIYMTEGKHIIQNSVIGWLRDDGIDAGSAGAGSVTVSNCWFESCYHEAMAWSGLGRIANISKSVVINCGQGVETGYSMGPGSPLVFTDNLLCIGNLIGTRFGDNYDSYFDGFLRVTNSLLLYNQRDVWGMNFQDWTYRTNRMDIQGNFLSVLNTNHPNNVLWNPSTDGWRLLSFKPTAVNSVGIGFGLRQNQISQAVLERGIPVGLSSFSTQVVSVSYSVESPNRKSLIGRLDFFAGELYKVIDVASWNISSNEALSIKLFAPTGGALSGMSVIYVVPNSSSPILHWFIGDKELTLAWFGTRYNLECSSNPTGPWTVKSTAQSPYTLKSNSGSQFFRLRR